MALEQARPRPQLVVARRAPPEYGPDAWTYELESAMDESGDDLDELPPDVRARFAERMAGAFGFGPTGGAR